MRALNRDIVFSLLILLISVTAGWVAFGYAADSSRFPRVLSVFLGLMALLLLVRSRRTLNEIGTESLRGQLSRGRAAIIVFAAAILYALAIQIISFEIANYLFLVATMYLLGQRNPVVIVSIATATMLLVKLLFFFLLDVSRPQTLLF